MAVCYPVVSTVITIDGCVDFVTPPEKSTNRMKTALDKRVSGWTTSRGKGGEDRKTEEDLRKR